MPIKPPRLDDRSYEDLVREARALIPQYCPEWTHLGDSDPGMTLVQLFAWMTEMTLYRLNRVPDKTYIHFLNFIGEERRTATPAIAPISFSLRSDDRRSAEIPAHTRCSTRQQHGEDALHFLTTRPVTVHGARIDRIVVVAAEERPMVREIHFHPHPQMDQAIVFGEGQGVVPFDLDPVDDGAHAYTRDQFVYVRHDDFVQMGRTDADDEEDRPSGTLRLSAGDPGRPVAALFDWEYPAAGDTPWRPIHVDPELTQDVMGLPEVQLTSAFPGLTPMSELGDPDDPVPLPEDLPPTGWIRGRVQLERWLAKLMEEADITWTDDRGAEERTISNWMVRDVGRTLEFFVPNLPPIRSGWLLRFIFVDHGLPSGRETYLPMYRWSYRRGDRWISIPQDRVVAQGATLMISGPLTDMATDGFNLRAERAETVHLEGLFPGLQAEIVWRRPIEIFLASGPEDDGASPRATTALPMEPFQATPTLPPMLGMKMYLGSDLLANRMRGAILVELEVGFERGGELVAEPIDDYHLQLTYRTASGWQVVHGTEEIDYARFTFSELDPDGAEEPQRRRIRMLLDPRQQLDGLARATVATQSTHWLRLELTRAALTHQPDRKVAPEAVSLRIYGVDLSLDGRPGVASYDEPMPGGHVLGLAQRPANRRFTRLSELRDHQVVHHWPFDDLLDTDDPEDGHRAIYLRFDRPLPQGRRHALQFEARGETFLPTGTMVQWDLLTRASRAGGRRWLRLASHDDPQHPAHALDRSGVLAFPLDEDLAPASDGVWLRGLLRPPAGHRFPALPPLTHLLLNSVDATNLHGFRMEKFSGEGVPHQQVQLRHFPIHLDLSDDRDAHTELAVFVEEGDGDRRPWKVAVGNSFATATKDDRVFVVDAVEGTLTFGNGIRGRIPPVGTFNIVVERYHTVPGAPGNVAAGEVVLAEAYGDVVQVHNLLPAHGGRNAESIDEIIRRAPSILTSRDRAVTRQDFEVIAEEASAEVARAAAGGTVGADGGIEVVILPKRRPGEEVPDPFVAAGLKDHVQRYLARRCLVNVRPRVRLATFRVVDVSVRLRSRAHANPIHVREEVLAWIRRFLDPYEGGLDRLGWPFSATLYAQDFGRMVTEIAEVRHVVEVDLYKVDDLEDSAGWQRIPGIERGDVVMPLDDADLFRTRHIRVQLTEERP